MNVSATNKKQSKRLISAGIDVNTADMIWCDGKDAPEVRSHRFIADSMTPAWSLGALIMSLPIQVKHNGLVSYLEIVPIERYNVWEIRWVCNGFINPFAYNKLLHQHIRFRNNNILEAAVHAKEWLLKNRGELK